MDLCKSIENQTSVSLAIAHKVALEHGKDSNLVFSPLSINIALSLIAAGSKGQTLEQLLSFLKSNSSEDLNSISSQLVSLVLADGGPSGGPQLSFANGVWVDQSLHFKASFKQVVDTVYKAASDSVNFQTEAIEVTNQVNSWAEKETNGLVKVVLPSGSVDASTRLIIANAVYFKGAWKEKFDSWKTKDYDFHLLNGDTVQAPFMTSSKKKQLVSEFDGFKVLALGYKQGEDKRRFTMYIYLPGTKDGLPSLMEKLVSAPDYLSRHLPYDKVGVGDFRIPRFKICFGYEASDTLKGLGLVLPFSGDGLTEMVDSPVSGNLYVSSIFHKSFIEVNEEGTEAAAASAVRFVKCCDLMMKEKIDFVADHPFLFVIREDTTGVVLFVGHVLNPLGGLS